MIFKKKYIINFKVNDKNEVELPENFDETIFELIRYSRKISFNCNLSECYEYELEFVDENNLVESRLNFLAKWYIKECLKDSYERNFAVSFHSSFANDPQSLLKSLRNFINYSYRAILIEDRKIYHNYPKDQYLFDVIMFNNYIKVFIPKHLVSQDSYEQFLGLGKDYLMGSFEPSEIEKYILPHYVMFLLLNDKLNDKEYNIKNAMIGLH